jgi:hypothetical protein
MINPINEDIFYKEFMETPRGKALTSEYDLIYCVRNVLDASRKNGMDMTGQTFWEEFAVTPREILGNPDIKFNRYKKSKKRFSITPFYYLKFLEEKNPETIADIGCGWNVFKKYIPNITGFDVMGSNADIIETYNSDFIIKYNQKFDAAFAINIQVVTWDTIGQFITDFSKIIKPGGRGFLGIPSMFPLLLTSLDWYNSKGLSPYDPKPLSAHIDNIITDLGLTILSLESRVDFFQDMLSHDGDIRVVFEVPK